MLGRKLTWSSCANCSHKGDGPGYFWIFAWFGNLVATRSLGFKTKSIIISSVFAFNDFWCLLPFSNLDKKPQRIKARAMSPVAIQVGPRAGFMACAVPLIWAKLVELIFWIRSIPSKKQLVFFCQGIYGNETDIPQRIAQQCCTKIFQLEFQLGDLLICHMGRGNYMPSNPKDWNWHFIFFLPPNESRIPAGSMVLRFLWNSSHISAKKNPTRMKLISGKPKFMGFAF